MEGGNVQPLADVDVSYLSSCIPQVDQIRQEVGWSQEDIKFDEFCEEYKQVWSNALAKLEKQKVDIQENIVSMNSQIITLADELAEDGTQAHATLQATMNATPMTLKDREQQLQQQLTELQHQNDSRRQELQGHKNKLLQLYVTLGLPLPDYLSQAGSLSQQYLNTCEKALVEASELEAKQTTHAVRDLTELRGTCLELELGQASQQFTELDSEIALIFETACVPASNPDPTQELILISPASLFTAVYSLSPTSLGLSPQAMATLDALRNCILVEREKREKDLIIFQDEIDELCDLLEIDLDIRAKMNT